MIWKAFQRTGCGVANDGHLKEQIDPINLRGKWTCFDPTKVGAAAAMGPGIDV